MIKEGMETIAFTIWLVDQWPVWILYLASITFLFLNNKKHLFSQYIKVSITGILIIFNPLFCGFITKFFFSDSRYFRTLWLLPIYFVIAIAAAEICANKKIIYFFICIILTCITGKFEFTENISFAENIYKLPQEVIDICEYFKQTEEYANNLLKISAEPYLSTFIRQYDSNIRLQFGRSSTVYTESVEAEMAFVQISVNAGEERDLYLLTKALRNDKCSYLVIGEGKIIHDEIQSYGFIYLDTISGYEIYQDTWCYDTPGSMNTDNESVVLDIENGKLVEFMRRSDGSLYKVRYVLEEYVQNLSRINYDKDTHFFYAIDSEADTVFVIREYSGIVEIAGLQQRTEEKIMNIGVASSHLLHFSETQ